MFYLPFSSRGNKKGTSYLEQAYPGGCLQGVGTFISLVRSVAIVCSGCAPALLSSHLLVYHTQAARREQVFLCHQRHDTELFPRPHRPLCFQPMENQASAGSAGKRR